MLQGERGEPPMPRKAIIHAIAASVSVALGVPTSHVFATLYARTVTGAVCTASVVYSTGHAPQSFDGSARTVGSSAVVSWTWHMASRGTAGTATVTCSFHGQTKSAATAFAIS
jgi:hypothetical protein